jgi:hypothetical protein
MRRTIGAAVTLLSLIAAPSAVARVVPVSTLPSADVGEFNSPDCGAPGGDYTRLLSHGVHIGGFDGPANVGGIELNRNPANGRPLSALTALSYDGRALPSTTAGWSFLQIVLDGTDAITYSPNTQPGGSQVTGSGSLRNWDVVAGTARYSDAIGNGDDEPFAAIQARYGARIITGISIFGGPCAGSQSEVDFDAVTVGTATDTVTFDFGTAVAVGTSTGGAGAVRPVPGPRGPAGGVAGVQTGQTCTGNALRTLRAPRRVGERMRSVRATLRGRRLGVDGRRIRVDLRNRAEGNYNVRITTRYVKRNGGKDRIVRTVRNLSVVCS